MPITIHRNVSITNLPHALNDLYLSNNIFFIILFKINKEKIIVVIINIKRKLYGKLLIIVIIVFSMNNKYSIAK